MHSASVVDARRYQWPMKFAKKTNNSKANQLLACSLFAHVHAARCLFGTLYCWVIRDISFENFFYIFHFALCLRSNAT